MLEITLAIAAAAQAIAVEPPEEAPQETPAALEWFPKTLPEKAPYLEYLNVLGDTCLQPGALIEHDPLSEGAQQVKSHLADAGFEYLLYQSYSLAVMTDTVQGNSTLNAYTLQLYANWNVFKDPGAAGWISTELFAGSGLGVNWEDQNPQTNLGTLNNPAGAWLPPSFWAAQLAWGMSMCDGKLVVLAGLVDQSSYIDTNTYAQNQYGQLLNEAFINSYVLPISFNNLGVNVQWQPSDSFYAIAGISANNQASGHSPFVALSTADMSYLTEFGFVTEDFLGLGKGVYRLQPFVATVEGRTGVGLGVNIEQALGKDSPVGVFGRFGVAQERVSTVGGASAQAAFGLAILAPFTKSGAFSGENTNYIGLGAKWAREAITNLDEYSLEATYNMQVTSTISLQPDVQVVFDPVANPDASTALIFQFQVNMVW